MKFSIFATEKNLHILHGHVFVMHCFEFSGVRTLGAMTADISLESYNWRFFFLLRKKVQVGNDQEKAQSERNSHSKT